MRDRETPLAIKTGKGANCDERTTDPRGAEMFHSLARDEELHLRIIRSKNLSTSTS